MKTTVKKYYLAALCWCIIGSSFGQGTDKINIVSTAVPFLRISPDARAGGMGETGISTTPNANSQFYNVSKYAFVKDQSGVSVSYTPWLKDLGLKDVYLASAAGYYKPNDEQAFSASLRYFSLGNIDISDAYGNDLGQTKSSELGFDLGYSRKLTEHMSLGVALRYIYSNLAGNNTSASGSAYKAGTAIASDLGLYYQKEDIAGEGWHAGVALSNLGGKIAYTDDATQKNYLPANLGIGAGYTWVMYDVHKLSVYGEINKLLVPKLPDVSDSANYKTYASDGVVGSWFKSFSNNAMAYSIGGEYVYNRLYALRAGFYTDSRTMGSRSYFTAGMGMNYSMFGLNFSYLVPNGSGVNRNPLSNTLRFSLLFYLGKDDEK